jgi:cytochrome c oxidase subunit I+III
MAGVRSHSAWAMGVLMLVSGAVFASLVFSRFYVDEASATSLSPNPVSAGLAALGLIVAAALTGWQRSLLARKRGFAFSVAIIGGLAVLGAATVAHFLAIDGADPTTHAHAASLHAVFWWQALHVLVVALMGVFCVARHIAGKLDAVQRVCFDNTQLLWLYTCGQGLLSQLL